MPARPTRSRMTLAKQICEVIPAYLVPRLAREHGIDARKFTAWSHVVAHLSGQITHAVGLNDICDGLELNSSNLRAIRGATPPKRNTFSHANRTRDSRMAKTLYWKVSDHLCAHVPAFGSGKVRSGYLRRFRTAIHAVDSTTIHLVANCMDWARHRRRKAAAKCHMTLDLQSMLPRYAVVDTASVTDNRRAREICSGLRNGEIVVFDRAYVDFTHLNDLEERGVCWVSRSKTNMKYRVVDELPRRHQRVLHDQIVELADYNTKKKFAKPFRLVTAIIEVEGKERTMTFISNNMHWSAWTVAELYRARWEIEVFFKELKQTVQLVDFIGHNRNAVEWQVWMALLAHLLMRFLAHLSRWAHTFTRLFTLVRAGLWHHFDILKFLEHYGTAGGLVRMRACPQQAYLPGFAAVAASPVGQPKRRKPAQWRIYAKIMQRTDPTTGTKR